MLNWAGKKGGGTDLDVKISPHGIEGWNADDKDSPYVEPIDISELEELDEEPDPCPDVSSLEDLI